LVEWDSDMPAYAQLCAEVHAADQHLDAARNAHEGIAA
jgi:uncharacterized protein (UPF0276 family)